MEQMVDLIPIQVHIKHEKVLVLAIWVCQIVEGVSVHGASGDEGFALMSTDCPKVNDCAVAIIAILRQLDRWRLLLMCCYNVLKSRVRYRVLAAFPSAFCSNHAVVGCLCLLDLRLLGRVIARLASVVWCMLHGPCALSRE